MDAALQYFDRAAWALHNATNDSLPLNVKSHLTAVALHACQSLKESLAQMLEGDNDDPELAAAIKNLPHTELIGNVRNMDLHGWPIPICDPQVRMVAMVSKPDQPIELSSSHGVGVSMHMDGLKPRVHRSPKDLKRGTVSIGGATVSYGCDQGKLIVHDFSTGQDYFLLGVLRSFLQRCHLLLKDRMPSAVTGAEKTAEPKGTE
ncbi:MAG: hypothetical protein ACYS0G_13600 [Planctomycetota bacterium]|jgi:hypothetical protein